MIIEPFGSNVVIRPEEKPTETSSGIEMPTGNRKIVDRPTLGEVIAVGPDCKHAKVGDQIYFDKYKLAELDFHDGDLFGSIAEADLGGRIVS